MRKYKRLICACILLAIEDERRRLEEASFPEIGIHTAAIKSLVEDYLMITRRGEMVEEYVGLSKMDEANEEAEDAGDS